jgi:hypothetical protein
VLERLLLCLLTVIHLPFFLLQMLMMLAGRDPAVLHALGVTQASLQQQLAAHRAAAKWATMSAADKASGDAQEWRAWLVRYRQRLQQEADAGAATNGNGRGVFHDQGV